MQVWNDYDPVWYETEYITHAEVKILVTSELVKKLKKIHSNLVFDSTVNIFNSTIDDSSGHSCRNYIINLSIQKTMKEYLLNHQNFGSFQDFDSDIFYQTVSKASSNYILLSHSYRIIKKWVKSWVIFKLYHPPGITRTSVTGKIYGNANGGLRYKTSRDRFRQLKYKMNRKDNE